MEREGGSDLFHTLGYMCPLALYPIHNQSNVGKDGCLHQVVAAVAADLLACVNGPENCEVEACWKHVVNSPLQQDTQLEVSNLKNSTAEHRHHDHHFVSIRIGRNVTIPNCCDGCYRPIQ